MTPARPVEVRIDSGHAFTVRTTVSRVTTYDEKEAVPILVRPDPSHKTAARCAQKIIELAKLSLLKPP